jgi:hypothetical protein
MKVRLTRKYAERINGIDLEGRKPGDLLDLSPPDARMIVAENWAVPERRERDIPTGPQRRAEDYPSEDERSS